MRNFGLFLQITIKQLRGLHRRAGQKPSDKIKGVTSSDDNIMSIQVLK